jgi:Spy/CpxP family protein refolding chaperone
MKTNKLFLKSIILILLFSMILIEVSAQNRNEGNKGKGNPNEQLSSPPSPPSPPPPPPPPDVDQDDMHPPLNLPDLTDEQKEKIKKIDLKQLETMTPLRNQMREKRVRLSIILTTMPVDMKAADQAADEIGKIAASILKAQIRHDQELRNLLTPDQQIIFDSRPKPFLRKPR